MEDSQREKPELPEGTFVGLDKEKEKSARKPKCNLHLRKLQSAAAKKCFR